MSLLTLLIIFVVAIVFSTILTYVVRWLGVRLGAVDVPMARKVHTTPIPRIGGLAVFVSFVAMMAIMNLFSTRISESFHFDHRATFGFYGALVVFGCGLWDDFRRLNPWIKLLFQIAGASLAFAGGISISGIFFDGHGIQFGIQYFPNHLLTYFRSGYSLPVTEKIYDEVFSIPLHPQLTDADIELICSLINSL